MRRLTKYMNATIFWWNHEQGNIKNLFFNRCHSHRFYHRFPIFILLLFFVLFVPFFILYTFYSCNRWQFFFHYHPSGSYSPAGHLPAIDVRLDFLFIQMDWSIISSISPKQVQSDIICKQMSGWRIRARRCRLFALGIFSQKPISIDLKVLWNDINQWIFERNQRQLNSWPSIVWNILWVFETAVIRVSFDSTNNEWNLTKNQREK